MLTSWIQQGFEACFPAQCLLCQQASHRRRELCTGCEADLPWLGARCRQCAIPLPIGSDLSRCGQCLQKPPAYQRCLCPLRYEFPVNRLITGFKHHRQISAGKLLANLWLEACFDDFDGATPDLIVPVPLHWWRHWRRGYNQSEYLAAQWSKALGITQCNAVKRLRATPAQQGLSAKDRRRNLRQAFTVSKAGAIAGKHIALVDDVLTTGATAHSVAAILARNGATQVDIWCLARTP